MTRPRVRSFVALLAITVLLLTHGAHAYVTYSRWYIAPAQIPYLVNPQNASVTSEAALTAVQSAAAAWSTQSHANIALVYTGLATDTSTALDQRNVVLFRDVSNGYTLATTYAWYDGSRIYDSDTVIYDGGYKFFTGTSGCVNGAYVEDVMTHEFGHALGLLHSTVSDATMNALHPLCDSTERTLAPDDIAGIEYLYPFGTFNWTPTVSITAPANGSVFPVGSTVQFSGTAHDIEDGTLTNLAWSNPILGTFGTGLTVSVALPSGVQSVTASATDSGGATGTASIAVAMQEPVFISISAPLEGTKVQHGHDFDIKATATGSAHPVQRVEFAVNGTTFCTDYTSTYDCKWHVPNPIGVMYTLTAIGYDTAGQSSTSKPVHVTSK